MQLSSIQKEIVNYDNKNMLVVAGAGSGKTLVLIKRIKKLLKDNNNLKILAVTFTKKAQLEMIKRLNNDSVDVLTFDALFYSYHNKNERIFILEESNFLQEDLLKINMYDIDPKKLEKPNKYDNYIKYKELNKLFDFNDLTKNYINILKESNNKHYDVVFIDEFQDVNKLQLEVVEEMIKKNSIIFAVGDPDQSIYGFRGSYPNIMQKIVKKHNFKVFNLNDNYRSVNNIVKYANKVISNNKNSLRKPLNAINNNYGLINIFNFNTDEEIFSLILKHFNKTDYKTYAILFRTHKVGYYYKQQIILNNLKIETLTIHESKGLEFDCIYLIGLDEGVFPSLNNLTQKSLYEERRLFYVAVTRAKKTLLMFYKNKKSRFLK